MSSSSAALTPSEWSLEDGDRLELDNLLADEVTRGLGAAEADELRLLLHCARTGSSSKSIPADEDPLLDDPVLEELHRAAAVAELCLIAKRQHTEGAKSPAFQMPATVEADLRVLAKEEAKRLKEGKVLPFSQVAVFQSGLSPAWWVAAAATFLAALAWWPRADAPDEAASATVVADAAQVSEPAALDSLAGTVTLAFAPTEDPSANGASGSVLWNPALQRGEMRIDGLAVNDPGDYQYQLWIFDAERDERYPVDGGVFDIDGATVIVAVTPPVPVTEATLFAVTVEPPGGVVVSGRERIALVASPEAAA